MSITKTFLLLNVSFFWAHFCSSYSLTSSSPSLKMRSCHIAQAGFKFIAILLPQLSPTSCTATTGMYQYTRLSILFLKMLSVLKGAG